MSNSKLLSLTVERFKSFEVNTRVDFAPLTIVLGRNNCGKSSLIQSMLLLKQTLNDPRADVMLRLEGVVEAFNLRELTFGWPAAADEVDGPSFSLEWESDVDMGAALEKASYPDLEEVAKNSTINWLRTHAQQETLQTKITLRMKEVRGVTQIHEILLWSHRGTAHSSQSFFSNEAPLVRIVSHDGAWKCYWQGELASKLDVELQHFIPFLLIDRRNIGPRNRQRSWHNAFLMLFEQPLADLTLILSDLHFLGSSRQPPPTLYKAATAAPNEVGVSGELAAQLLHRRQHDLVHFLPPLEIADGGALKLPESVRVRSMVNAVNEVMSALSINAPIKIQEIHEVGFRLMFGEASLMHVGRGLNSLLPLVELGLFADPIRFTGSVDDMPMADYRKQCGRFAHIALEEPEAHLHPKVASRLAHWLVSLAMTNRRLVVETHSDHLVRRLRGLVARAGKGTALEEWLLQNVAIVSVEQIDGRSSITTSYLTSEGGVAEKWPADFMDEATDEESAIYYAKLDKSEVPNASISAVRFEEGPEPEPETAP
jgi:energy-coupling factor transporter ATP-binding protein EcfA2